uniref:SWIM-type domain-containing protein n=1 Tax=Magallana gigas TaxID=29159 RepID=A0A8W8KYV8_MAGGI
MQCYRQYIRGLNFYKEGYIHKIMINEISDTCQMCYIRSKCYPSMHKGVYEQWLLVSKEEPFQVVKANCTCPAGCGEGCTHIAGLLFALEGRPSIDELEDMPCTSKPCQWNQPKTLCVQNWEMIQEPHYLT